MTSESSTGLSCKPRACLNRSSNGSKTSKEELFENIKNTSEANCFPELRKSRNRCLGGAWLVPRNVSMIFAEYHFLKITTTVYGKSQ